MKKCSSRFYTLRKNVPLILLICSFLVTGCDREEVLEEVENFSKAAIEGSNSIPEYYSNLNQQELDIYFEYLKLYPELEVGNFIRYTFIDENDREQEVFVSSPLEKPIFSTEGIQDRVDMISSIIEYSKALALLATDESPEKFETNILTANSSLIALEKTISQSDNSALEKYSTPITKLIGIIGKRIINEVRWEEIQEAVRDAQKPVNEILDFVAADLDKFADPIEDIAALDRYATYVNIYNSNRNEYTPAQREKILDRIREYKKTYDRAKLAKPSAIPLQIKKAHEALVSAVESDADINDIALLKAELEQFEKEVAEVKASIYQKPEAGS